METNHTLVVLVEDQPGVLNRIVSLLRRRSFNIESITVGASEQAGLSRITLVVNGEDAEVEQVGKQLYKLLEVVKVTDLSGDSAVYRELVLIKVAAKAQTRAEVLTIAGIYDAKVLDATPSTLMLEATGDAEAINSFLNMMRPFGVREMVRTGRIAMSRSGQSKANGRIDRISNDSYAVAD